MKKNKEVLSIFIRYLLIILAGLGDLFIFYKIFTTPTIFLVKNILNLISPVTSLGNIILFNSFPIQLVSACIAGAAYYLLFILIMSTPKIKTIKRIELIFLSFALFLIINVIRIVILSLTLNFSYFNLLHEVFWYALSTLFVIGIWFLCARLFKIKTVPVYSDIKELYLITKN